MTVNFQLSVVTFLLWFFEKMSKNDQISLQETAKLNLRNGLKFKLGIQTLYSISFCAENLLVNRLYFADKDTRVRHCLWLPKLTLLRQQSLYSVNSFASVRARENEGDGGSTLGTFADSVGLCLSSAACRWVALGSTKII